MEGATLDGLLSAVAILHPVLSVVTVVTVFQFKQHVFAYEGAPYGNPS
jgi:hypothetical protein